VTAEHEIPGQGFKMADSEPRELLAKAKPNTVLQNWGGSTQCSLVGSNDFERVLAGLRQA
jgi:hypothetical protein